MSWIKISQYLPGNNREIQVWGRKENQTSYDPRQNYIVRYYVETNKFKMEYGGEIIDITHWADMLGQPEDT